jgi:hypothetical protein
MALPVTITDPTWGRDGRSVQGRGGKLPRRFRDIFNDGAGDCGNLFFGGGTAPENGVAQTFTVPSNMSLRQVGIKLNRNSIAVPLDNFICELRDASPTGTLRATASVAANSVGSTSNPTVETLFQFPSGTALTTGNTYCIVVIGQHHPVKFGRSGVVRPMFTLAARPGNIPATPGRLFPLATCICRSGEVSAPSAQIFATVTDLATAQVFGLVAPRGSQSFTPHRPPICLWLICCSEGGYAYRRITS